MQTRFKAWGALLVAFVLVGAFVFAMAGPSQAQGGVTGFASLRVANFFRLQPRTAITVANGSTVDTTGSYQRLTAAGAVAASLSIEPAGSVVTLVNVGSNTITFTETGNIISAGNIALGANDSATLYSDGTSWFQVAASNN